MIINWLFELKEKKNDQHVLETVTNAEEINLILGCRLDKIVVDNFLKYKFNIYM